MSDHVKLGAGEADVERLRGEAAVLDAVRHPGVVELLGFTAEGGVAELRTALVEGTALASSDDLTPGAMAALAAGVAATLADLHEAGLAHGAIDATHVLLTPTAPVLCGFGKAGRITAERTAEADVAALGRLVLERCPRGPVAGVARRAVDGALDARAAAAAFGAAASDAHVEPGPDPAGLRDLVRPGRRRRSGRTGVVVAGLAAVLGVLALGLSRWSAGDGRDVGPVAPPEPATTTGPTTTEVAAAPTRVWTAGPPPTLVIDGATYALGGPGSVAVAGPWGCPAEGAAAVLRLGTGEVFVFGELAARDRDVTGTPVGTVVDAEGIEVGDVDADGCSELVVTRADGAPTVIDTEVDQ